MLFAPCARGIHWSPGKELYETCKNALNDVLGPGEHPLNAWNRLGGFLWNQLMDNFEREN